VQIQSQPSDKNGGSVWERQIRTRTDEDGVFELTALEDGEHVLTPSHDDYFFAGDQPQLGFTVPLEAGATLDLKMLPAGKVDGQISGLPEYNFESMRFVLRLTPIDENGAEISRATSTAGGPPTARFRQSKWLDRDGKFHKGSIPPGRYRARLSSNLFRREPGKPPEQSLPRESGELEVSAGQTETFNADYGSR
jgi:hypothetical protein